MRCSLAVDDRWRWLVQYTDVALVAALQGCSAWTIKVGTICPAQSAKGQRISPNWCRKCPPHSKNEAYETPSTPPCSDVEAIPTPEEASRSEIAVLPRYTSSGCSRKRKPECRQRGIPQARSQPRHVLQAHIQVWRHALQSRVSRSDVPGVEASDANKK